MQKNKKGHSLLSKIASKYKGKLEGIPISEVLSSSGIIERPWEFSRDQHIQYRSVVNQTPFSPFLSKLASQLPCMNPGLEPSGEPLLHNPATQTPLGIMGSELPGKRAYERAYFTTPRPIGDLLNETKHGSF